MIEKMKTIGSAALGLAIVFAVVFAGMALLKGTAVAAAWAFPVLTTVVGFITILGLPVLLVLAAIPASRFIAGGGFVVASYFYGATLWIWSFFFTLQTWGWFAVIVGVFMAGVGVVPIAILAALFHGRWSIIAQLLLGLLLTFGCRLFGLYLAAKAEERANRLSFTSV